MKRIVIWFLFLGGLSFCFFHYIRLVDSSPQSNAGIFMDSGQALGNMGTQAVAAAYLDSDSDLDIFAANNGGNRVWLNDGNGQFADNGQLLGSANSEGVELADFDNDNDVDAVVANSDAPSQVWLNDGAGQFTAGQLITGTVTRDVAVGDLNGDGESDLYFTNQGADAVWWGQGNGTFADSGQVLDADIGYSVALGDLDGDSDLDAYVANGGGVGAPDTVWINQGGSQGGTEGVFLDSGQTLGFIWTSAVALAELDGVSGLDAMTASWFPSANKLWRNDGAGTMTDSGQTLGAESSLSVDLGDVDGDLDLDAIVGNNLPHGGKLWINDGNGQFTDSGDEIALNETVHDAVLADLNGNGTLDLFLGITGPNQVWFNQASTPFPPTVGYQPQIVDARGNVGESSAIVLDASGYPHISYTRYQLHRDGLNYSVRYARWDGVRWHTEQVSLVEQFGAFSPYATAIALDSQGQPVIAYVTPSRIHYATRGSGGIWGIQVLSVGQNLRNRIAMDLDVNDNPHIVNFNSEAGQLVYRVFDGAWSAEVIDPAATDDLFPDIELDASDNPHVSYYSWGDKTLRYAHKVGSVWQSDVVENSLQPQDFPYTSIALDSTGRPGIAYNWNDDSELKFAQWNGASWDIVLVDTVPSTFSLDDRSALAFDSQDNPHIISAPNNGLYIELIHNWWDGTAWMQRTIENSGFAGIAASLDIDAQDNVHISYYDKTHEDLRYVTWQSEFTAVAVAAGVDAQAVALGMRNDVPTIGYYDASSGQVAVAEWQEPWLFDPLASSTVPPDAIAAATWHANQHVSYYDADNQRLLYARWNGTTQYSTVVDETGDVGRYNDIALVGGSAENVRIAYWDATNKWIRLAELNGNDLPVLHVNDQAPPLNAASGHVSITELVTRQVGISYYDGVNGDLRFALWDPGSNGWGDQYVDGAGIETGRLNDIQVDAADGAPVIAYYDETNDAIKLAYRTGISFTTSIAVGNVGGVSSLALALNLNSRQQARILYTTPSNELRLASLNNGVWRIKQIVGGSGAAANVAALSLDNRLHYAYGDDTNGLKYGFRTNNLDFGQLPGEPPVLGDGYYNPVDGCLSVLQWAFGGDDDERHGGRTPRGLAGPQTDVEVFSEMASLFSLYGGGQHYIDLYLDHGTEMAQITLADPALMWDSYGVLQNFMPGLEALVTGRGDELLISQEMVDDALDIWQRIAAAGSPGLAAAINGELALYNNLQGFVGMSFDQWAEAVGVQPLDEVLYFPIIAQD